MEKGLFPSALRRLRSNALIRSLVNPMRLSHQSFILPLFVEQDLKEPRLVKYMHGVKVETPSSIFKAIDDALDSGISKFLIFPVPSLKSSVPSDFLLHQMWSKLSRLLMVKTSGWHQTFVCVAIPRMDIVGS